MDIRIAHRNTTREKRKLQTCKVIEAKIDRSHLAESAKRHLDCLFKEAKWFYNYCLSHDNIKDADTTAKQVPVKVGEEYEDTNVALSDLPK